MLTRRQFQSKVFQLSLADRATSLFAEEANFTPTWPSLQAHQVPVWFQDAKLGIFIHWGLYSVPAWATPSGELGKFRKTNGSPITLTPSGISTPYASPIHPRTSITSKPMAKTLTITVLPKHSTSKTRNGSPTNGPLSFKRPAPVT